MQIAEQVGLSEKTVRTKMDLINDWLEEENLGRIERRQGKGIWLAADENQKKRLNQLLLSDQDLKPAACQDSRNKQLIGKLLKLKPGEITTLQQLADSLYLSPPTVGGLLRDVAGWFSERSLRIVSMRSKGVCLEGEEYSFRIAIRDYMMDMMPEVLEALLGKMCIRDRLMCAPMHGRLPRMPLYMPSGITLGWTICTCAWRLRQESNSLSKIT